ncbi:MAG: hypothetical protein GY754_01605 [bacterium]|nr:hypothetical protein [bacterium]
MKKNSLLIYRVLIICLIIVFPVPFFGEGPAHYQGMPDPDPEQLKKVIPWEPEPMGTAAPAGDRLR